MTDELEVVNENMMALASGATLDYEAARDVCRQYALSPLCPEQYRGKPRDIFFAWQKGAAVGLGMQESLESIAVIKGRATIWGEAVMALVHKTKELAYFEETLDGSADQGTLMARCVMRRKGVDGDFVGEFSVEDAKRAGLWGKGTYDKYPKDMLPRKARWRAIQRAFPDALTGLHMREEVADFPDAHEADYEVVPASGFAPKKDEPEPAPEALPEPEIGQELFE